MHKHKNTDRQQEIEGCEQEVHVNLRVLEIGKPEGSKAP
jgi:hypothetical protein